MRQSVLIDRVCWADKKQQAKTTQRPLRDLTACCSWGISHGRLCPGRDLKVRGKVSFAKKNGKATIPEVLIALGVGRKLERGQPESKQHLWFSLSGPWLRTRTIRQKYKASVLDLDAEVIGQSSFVMYVQYLYVQSSKIPERKTIALGPKIQC